MAGIRALSVSKTTPTGTGIPPDADMGRLVDTLKKHRQIQRKFKEIPNLHSKSWKFESVISFCHSRKEINLREFRL